MNVAILTRKMMPVVLKPLKMHKSQLIRKKKRKNNNSYRLKKPKKESLSIKARMKNKRNLKLIPMPKNLVHKTTRREHHSKTYSIIIIKNKKLLRNLALLT